MKPIAVFTNRPARLLSILAPAAFLLLAGCTGQEAAAQEEEIVVLGHPDRHCADDPDCFNRLHPDIPMAAHARPGQTILLKTRNALDMDLVAEEGSEPADNFDDFGAVHPLTGPVYIEGAEPGDTLAVTLLDIAPGKWGRTGISEFGYAYDLSGEDHAVFWRLNRKEARSPTLKGVAIPNASFPGVVTTLPGRAELNTMLARETALAAAGGDVFGPLTDSAYPASVCGEGAPGAAECLRTIPPREHGGNLDTRYFKAGITIYLPCYVEGCGLGVGDLHFAQGDGEVSGEAIEMDADVTLVTEVIKGGLKGVSLPAFEGPSYLLDIPSRRFFATTGFPFKKAGTTPPEMAYLDSAKVAGLENLSRDINLAARNALDQMLDYIVANYGYTRAEAHIIASVAADMRIIQLVDAPNVGVSMLLPLDIFDEGEETPNQNRRE